ncbi:MAG TPA: hypothetical protein VMF13_18950 [Luteitalea sp.]|nr:hypothetical protein [Luteitalea sp.]
MATDHHHAHSSHGDDGAVPLNHETTDISLEGIGKLTAGFVVILLVVSALMVGAWKMLDRRYTGAGTSAERAADEGGEGKKALTRPTLMDHANAAGQAGRPAAGPMLLTNEPLWLAGIKRTQQDALTTYGWVDRNAGTVRLPIERAKQLIVERGLPKAAAPATATPADGAVPPAGDQGGTGVMNAKPQAPTSPQQGTAGAGPRPH